MSTTLDYKDIGIRKSEFVARTQFLSFEKYVPIVYYRIFTMIFDVVI